jgi:hypothetical protein
MLLRGMTGHPIASAALQDAINQGICHRVHSDPFPLLRRASILAYTAGLLHFLVCLYNAKTITPHDQVQL